jgi:hypothetical protein
VDAAGESDGLTSQRIAPSKSSTALTPDSTLLDEGLPDIDAKFDDSHSSGSGSGSTPVGKGHLLGSFVLPGGAADYANAFSFDLNLATGQITNALFYVEYDAPLGLSSSVRTISADKGAGYVDPSSYSFTVSGFSGKFEEDSENNSLAYGDLGASTTLAGSFLASPDFGASANGSLFLNYAPDASSPAITDMPSSLVFMGSVKEKPFYDVRGSFVITAGTETHNSFSFGLNPNDGSIFGGTVDINYDDPLTGVSTEIDLEVGTGSLSGSSFSVSFAKGKAYYSGNPVTTSLTGALGGAFSAANPTLGDEIVPSGSQLTLNYGVSTSLPTSFAVLQGAVEEIKMD